MRARILFHTLPLLCSGALLLACSGPSPRLPAAPSSAPATAAAADADADYLRGRALHLARRYDAAIAAYQDALRADAAHVNARNGLAVAYAERQDFAHAIPIWRGLTAGATLASGAERAFLFANLGHAYMLSGDLDAAQAALEKACLLDPLDERAWQYLGEALVRRGDEERGRQMLRQAEALRTHDFRSDYAAAARGARLPAIEQALEQEARSDDAWPVDQVTQSASGVFELRRLAPARTAARGAPAPAPVPMPSSMPMPAPPADVALLEISNGNGRQGLARQVARELRDPGLKVVRLSNEKGFAVRRTRIEYRPAFRAAAERLAQRVGARAPVTAASGARVDVRLVIGRDLARSADAADMTLAQVAPAGLPGKQ